MRLRRSRYPHLACGFRVIQQIAIFTPVDMLGRGSALEARKDLSPRSGEVEAISVHHLGPRRHEVFHELLLRVRARIDFG